jgi:hypothetical protein
MNGVKLRDHVMLLSQVPRVCPVSPLNTRRHILPLILSPLDDDHDELVECVDVRSDPVHPCIRILTRPQHAQLPRSTVLHPAPLLC